MGYRLDIGKIKEDKIEPLYYGTKLYGYGDEEEFISYLYLISIGKLKGDEYFNYGSGIQFALNKKEFTIFCNLYNIDMNNHYDYSNEKDIFINDETIQNELMTDILDYKNNEIYIIGWC